MKRILAVLLVFAMVLSLASCSKKKEASGMSGVANPITEYKSLEEINKEAAVELTAAKNASDERFSVIAKTETIAAVAQYRFSLNGIEFTYRACNGNYEDISGVYLNGSTAFDNFHPGNDDPLMMVGDGEYKLARWFSKDEVQYSLCAGDKGKLSQEEFSKIVEGFIEKTGIMIGAAEYEALEGYYTDEINQRPYMEVEAFGTEGVVIKVWWGSSFDETDYWTMQAKFDDESKLAYEWGTHERITLNEKEEESTELIAEKLSGYFTIDEEGKLSWEGAPEEDVNNCVFVKESDLVTEKPAQ